jgi:diketogulonate reductase-like aldo/keto reductase
MAVAAGQQQQEEVSRRLQLKGGTFIPLYGLGTWLAKENDCYTSVLFALQHGHRLIDTAQMYNNEEEVGRAIRDSGVKREDIFLSTKLLSDCHETPGGPRRALEVSLGKLGVGYVDLFLVHSPRGGNLVAVWCEMMQLKRDGLTRAIGVSNCGQHHIEGLLAAGLDAPEVNQVELHVYLPRVTLREFHDRHSIATMGFCPLARCKRFGVAGPVREIALSHGVSEAVVMLAWSLQSNVITIPKSSNPSRILDNAVSLSFSLSPQEMSLLSSAADDFTSSSAQLAMLLPWDEVK